MPETLSTPGVYLAEATSVVPAIKAAATSITAFIGRASRGPVDVPTAISSQDDYQRVFGGLSLDSPMSFAVRDFYENGGGEAVVVRLFNDPMGGAARLDADTLQLVAASPGSWGDSLRVVIEHHVTGGEADQFDLTIRDGVTGTIEIFRGVSVVAGAPTAVDLVLSNQSSLVRVGGALPASPPAANPAPLDSEQLWSDNPVPTNYSVAPPDRGTDGSVLTTADSFLPPGARAARIGLYALEHVDLFNLLCIPPAALAQPAAPAVDIEAALIDAATAYCAERRAVMIIDPPEGWTSATLAATGLGKGEAGGPSANAALYFPRLLMPNPLRQEQVEAFAPCGAVAGMIARTDAAHGVWKAPAGLEATLSGVTGLGAPVNDAGSAALNPLGVNCVREFAHVGTVVWGARTRAGDDLTASDWKYLSVRRTALMIEESLSRGLRFAVFEPNDESTWSAIRLAVTTFMEGLFRQGELQGVSPAYGFFVRCDGQTTTPADVAAGVVNVEVGLAPLKPAEFVVIRIQQAMAGGSPSL